jgi:hypothetical protein
MVGSDQTEVCQEKRAESARTSCGPGSIGAVAALHGHRMDTATSGAPQPLANWLPIRRAEERFGGVVDGDTCPELTAVPSEQGRPCDAGRPAAQLRAVRRGG